MTATETQSPLDAARKLAPMIRSCADQIEAERELPRPLFEALADAGLFQLALPRALGGAEIDLPTYAQVLEEIGKADASTGWIVNQRAIFATYAARMPHDIARLIWIDTPRSIVANTPLPTAQAIVVPGGYRVTGRQGFSTGCRHAGWLAARAQIIENGQLRLQDGQPEQLYLFVPAAGRAARHLACPGHARHGDLPFRRKRCLRARGAHGSPGRRSPAGDWTALPDTPDLAVRLGRCRGGPRRGPLLPRRVFRAGWRQDTASHAGDAPGSADDSSCCRARRSRPSIRTGLPGRGGP